MNKPDIAAEVTDQFYKSQALAESVADAVNSLGSSPLEIAFSGLLLDKIFTKRIPDWEKLRDFAMTSWKDMEKQGIIPEIP